MFGTFVAVNIGRVLQRLRPEHAASTKSQIVLGNTYRLLGTMLPLLYLYARNQNRDFKITAKSVTTIRLVVDIEVKSEIARACVL